MPVLVDVKIVVEVDEVVAGRLAEDGDYRQQQKAADGQQAVGPPGMKPRAPSRAIEGPSDHLPGTFRIATLRQSLLPASLRHLLCLTPGKNGARGDGRFLPSYSARSPAAILSPSKPQRGSIEGKMLGGGGMAGPDRGGVGSGGCFVTGTAAGAGMTLGGGSVGSGTADDSA